MHIAKNIAVLTIAIGILFGLTSIVLFIKQDIVQIVPRMDIAWIGFILAAIIMCVSRGGGVYYPFQLKNKSG